MRKINMKKVIILSLVTLFSIGCATIDEKMSSHSSDNQKVLKDCANSGTDSIKDSECQGAAKVEGNKMKEMMK